MTDHRAENERSDMADQAERQEVLFRDCLETRLAPMLSIARLMNEDTKKAERVVRLSAIDAFGRLNGERSADDCAARLSSSLVKYLLPEEDDLERASSRAVTADPHEAGLDNSVASSLSAVEAEAIMGDADRDTVNDAFRRLPRVERLVLAMITVGNHTSGEVSQMMDTTRDVIRRIRMQAQKRLYHELASLTAMGT